MVVCSNLLPCVVVRAQCVDTTNCICAAGRCFWKMVCVCGLGGWVGGWVGRARHVHIDPRSRGLQHPRRRGPQHPHLDYWQIVARLA